MPLVGEKLSQPVVLSRLLETGLQSDPQAQALVSLDRTWTWQELDNASSHLASQYLALGLKSGDRVASLLPNRGELLVHYLACFKAGFVATPLNYRYQAPEIDHALEVSEASLLIAHVERDEVLAGSSSVGKLPLGRISYGAPQGVDRRLEDLLIVEGDVKDHAPPAPDAPALIFFTSGSTGKPKGVTHSHDSFGWLVASAAVAFDFAPAEVVMPATSASHIAASSMMLAGLSAGSCVAVAQSVGGDEILPLLRATRPSFLCMLPTPLFGPVQFQGAAREDFQSVRRCVSGGDKISAELEREFIELTGFAIEEVYGMTETGTSVINPAESLNRLGSIGQLAPGYTASIRTNDGAEVPCGTPGRMWIKSASNMIGYWNRPDATAETIVDDWLDTGDLISCDPENYLWFCGRKKQIIVHDGSNICPQEVEESLLAHPAVAIAGVIGVHDLVHGENVRAYVVFRPGVAEPPIEKLIAFSREQVGYKAPDEILVLDEMPINATGKVDRVALKQMAESAANPHLSES